MKGVEFKVDRADHSAVGLLGSFLVFAENEETFKNAVDASQGESLAKAARYTSATSAKPAESLLNIYADIGGLIDSSGTPAASQTLSVLKASDLTQPMQPRWPASSPALNRSRSTSQQRGRGKSRERKRHRAA